MNLAQRLRKMQRELGDLSRELLDEKNPMHPNVIRNRVVDVHNQFNDLIQAADVFLGKKSSGRRRA